MVQQSHFNKLTEDSKMSEDKAMNMVTMANGEVLNFRENGKCFSGYDKETGTLTFKIVTGEVIDVNVADIPQDVKDEALLWGLVRYVTSKIPNVDADKVAEKVTKEVDSLKAGKFATRGASAGGQELDDFMVAFALVNATGEVNTGNSTFAVKQSFISVDELQPHWVNVNDPSVVAEVLAYWDSLSTKDKTNQKKNPFIKTQVELISTGVVEI